jgi:diadenylate cyclase
VSILTQFQWLAAADIVIVAVIFYQMLLLIQGTRAVQLIQGIFVLLVVSVFSRALELATLTWLLDKIWTMMLVALPVVFQPELRRALEQLGRGGRIINWRPGREDEEKTKRLAHELSLCAKLLSTDKIGALIALERTTGTQEYADTGISVDALVTSQLLINIFIPNTPLHDGAVLIRGDRIVAAGCVLPLTERDVDKKLGTRHRAGIGLSEVCDALVIIVSEETGVISTVQDGRLRRRHDEDSLKNLIHEVLVADSHMLPLTNSKKKTRKE